MNAYKVEQINNKRMLNFLVKRRGATQRWANIDFHEPSLKLIINENIEPEQLECTISIIFIAVLWCQHAAFSRNASLNDDIFDLLENLSLIGKNVHFWGQFHDWGSTIVVLLMTISMHCTMVIQDCRYFWKEAQNCGNVYLRWN